MKVRAFRARPFAEARALGRSVLRGTSYLAAKNWPWLSIMAAASVALALFLFPYDARLLATLHSPSFARQASAMDAAAFFGTWGDYPTYNLPLAILIWLYGYWRRSSAWRRIAVVCFLGATLAGIFDDCFRLTLGRPRPDAHMLDGFYGLRDARHSRFQSFPSGHAAAVFGTAISLLLTCRWLGLVTTAYALVVVWARMQLYRHYPSDVAVGSLIGMTFGALVAFGSRARRSRPLSPP